MRELSFYVGDQTIFGPPATCWSGLVLRGVSGKKDASRMVGTPIIGLKTGNDSGTFNMATFTPEIRELDVYPKIAIQLLVNLRIKIPNYSDSVTTCSQNLIINCYVGV